MRIAVMPYLFLGLLMLCSTGLAQNKELFNSGKEAYKNGDFQAAIDDWQKIIEHGAHSAELYFNLGNAHYKMNNIGPSIYYYEKARQLDPNDADIRNNLAFAENARVDAIEPLPQTVFRTWYKKLTGIFTYDGWAVTAVVFTFLFVMLFLMYYFSSSEQKKRLLFTGSIIAAILLVGSTTVAFLTFSDVQRDSPAIIFSESVDVMDAPSVGGEVSYRIHEGTKVQLLERDDNWVRIQLADGKDGWIPASDLKEL